MRTLLVSMIACLALSTSAIAGNLTAKEIKEKIIGHETSWKSGKYHGKALYSADGTAKIYDSNTRYHNDHGKWRFSGNKICVKWKRARHGRRYCYTISPRPDGSYYSSTKSTFTVQ